MERINIIMGGNSSPNNMNPKIKKVDQEGEGDRDGAKKRGGEGDRG